VQGNIEIIDTVAEFDIDKFISFESLVNKRLNYNGDQFAEILESISEEDEEPTSEAFLECYNSEFNPIKAVFYVENEDEDLLGGCVLWNASLDRVKIVDLAISEDCEGQGLGSILMDEAIAYCRRKKISQINLEVRDNTPAKFLYLNKGFEAVVLLTDFYKDYDAENLVAERGLEIPSQDAWYMELYL
jgi:ribosomal protein S18 acetylase RimI-like enzyme